MALSNHFTLTGLSTAGSTRVVLAFSPRKDMFRPNNFHIISTRYKIGCYYDNIYLKLIDMGGLRLQRAIGTDKQ